MIPFIASLPAAFLFPLATMVTSLRDGRDEVIRRPLSGQPTFSHSRSRVEFWTTKIASNRARDVKVNETLRAKGWNVIRLGDSKLAKGPENIASLESFQARLDRQPLHVGGHLV